jgi:hypothetical protein
VSGSKDEKADINARNAHSTGDKKKKEQKSEK